MRTLVPELIQNEPSAKTTGIVFDIQRSSLQDGPGIRTTVFLKGCPLHCAWCHNPESIAASPQVSFDAAKCVNCCQCVDVCETGAHFRDGAGDHAFDFEQCTACGRCIEVCVGQAIRILGQSMSIQEVVGVVLRDRTYYEKSGGGMTLSGGEPFFQFEFALGLLQAAKVEGIHTCVETSGAVSWRKIAEAIHWTDLFLFDYKVTNPVSHRKLVGCNNAPLLENLDRLIKAGAKVVLRCPLVPGINDGDKHLQGIASVSARYPQLFGIEIMPYHNFGLSKAEKIGQINTLPPIPPPSKECQDAWIARLHELGCTKAKLS